MALATADDAESRELCRLGACLEPVNFDRGGLSPAADMKAYYRLREIYRRWSPRMIQHFHAKPIISGSLAAHHVLKDSVKIVNTITGLGHAFINSGYIAKIADWGYRLALKHSDVTVFQNSDDKNLFLKNGWVTESKTRLIASSGVDIKRFAYIERNGRKNVSFKIVMIGRLLRQKGIPEFVEVASKIREIWPKAQFLLAGEEDPKHPDSISVKWLKKQKEVKYLGRLSDVAPLLNEADLFLFPSYREGAPRVVLEAAATGLPTVGFDVPGVREVVRDRETGYLVPYRDVERLVHKVKELLEDEELRLNMGWTSRKMVEDFFDINNILERYLKIYRELGLDI